MGVMHLHLLPYAAKDGNYGWHGQGGTTWNGGTPSNGTSAFNTKLANIATMNICVDLDSGFIIRLMFII